jgi:hypothetical protein
MSTRWLPFGRDDILQVEIVTKTQEDGYTEIGFSILSSTIADIYRFSYNQLNVLFISNPVTDDGIPVYPVLNEDGETRTDKIKIIISDDKVQETIDGVLSDLDEWIRSKFALSDQNLIEGTTYSFTAPS